MFDLWLLIFILMIVVSVRYRHCRIVWSFYAVLFFLPVAIAMILATATGLDVAVKSRQEKRQRRLRIKRRQLALKRASLSVLLPIAKMSDLISGKTRDFIAKDEQRARKRSILSPFAYISVWTPIRSNFRLYRDLYRSMRLNPRKALFGLRVGMSLSRFISKM